MTDRAALATAFLNRTDWADTARAPLAGDASNRRYERLRRPGTAESAVLMDAPPDKDEDVRPFVRIARHLRAQGLSAPEIYAEDTENGFLLLEDLGDDLFKRAIARDPSLEHPLYAAATDLLVDLHRAPLPDLDPYSPPVMTDLACLAFDRYTDRIVAAPTTAARERFGQMFEDILRQTMRDDPVLVMRDYHAENLLWLPDRTGVARVGLLDFQDAMSGHRSYDLVSLLQDIRRDVSPAIEAEMITRYIETSGSDDHLFRTAYAVQGAQRNLRIMGVFARLGTDFGKPHYVDMLPKVWSHLVRDLQHPALAPVADLVLTTLPEPTPDALQKLKPQ
ncbi:aminoglycoside phosphotransferase family protein [Arenibacterium sp. CAU 1754]